MARIGSPPVLDAEKKAKVLEVVAAGFPIRYAARYVGCDEGTIRHAGQRDPEFYDQVKYAQFRAEYDLVKNIRAASESGKNWRAAAWSLERLFPDRYGPHHRDEITNEHLVQLSRTYLAIVKRRVPEPLREEVIKEMRRASAEMMIGSAVHTVEDNARSGGLPEEFVPPYWYPEDLSVQEECADEPPAGAPASAGGVGPEEGVGSQELGAGGQELGAGRPGDGSPTAAEQVLAAPAIVDKDDTPPAEGEGGSGPPVAAEQATTPPAAAELLGPGLFVDHSPSASSVPFASLWCTCVLAAHGTGATQEADGRRGDAPLPGRNSIVPASPPVAEQVPASRTAAEQAGHPEAKGGQEAGDRRQECAPPASVENLPSTPAFAEIVPSAPPSGGEGLAMRPIAEQVPAAGRPAGVPPDILPRAEQVQDAPDGAEQVARVRVERRQENTPAPSAEQVRTIETARAAAQRWRPPCEGACADGQAP
jgi:hypothetical protein